MAKVSFKRKTTAEINELEIQDGALIYNTENGKTYMDFGEQRIQTGGNADTMIAIGETEPTDEDIKIWIDPSKQIKTPAKEENKNIYSTAETIIGTYLDKPLYRKVLVVTVPLNKGHNNIAHGISNLKRIINFGGSSDDRVLPIIAGSTALDYSVGLFNYTSTDIVVESVGSDWGSREWQFILEYTKTID